MTIIAECECGRKVEIDFDKTFINMPHSGYDILIGEQKCSNPDCDRTILVNANITVVHTEGKDYTNSKVNWGETKIGDVVYVDKCPYEVALKAIRRMTTGNFPEVLTLAYVLYLRSKTGDYKVVGEVVKNGSILLMYGKESSLTPAGYEAWTEEELLVIFNRLNIKERSL